MEEKTIEDLKLECNLQLIENAKQQIKQGKIADAETVLNVLADFIRFSNVLSCYIS